ncbi:membrane integrity-associated transporter subunit PqiC [Luteolibacter algae]|uniref:Membrane integrity-associated transporter subunit PqiC n=1 Tax=Luteolibacter algae TaxID=454151 RepID=A0ABW5D8G0_9BACT
MKFLPIIALCLSLIGCGSGGNYYVLATSGKAPSGGGYGIGIGPVTVADYLSERPYLIFQSTPTKMEVSDEHQWAGDLASNFSRTLGTDLGYHLGTGNIRQYPWRSDKELRYQITVDVNQFHGTADGEALLEASWRVYALPAGRLVASSTSTLREPLQADGFEKLAEAQSRLVDQLAKEIAARLEK